MNWFNIIIGSAVVLLVAFVAIDVSTRVDTYVGTGWSFFTDDYVDQHYTVLKVRHGSRYDPLARDIKIVRADGTVMMYFVRIKDGVYIEEQDYKSEGFVNVWVTKRENHAFIFECVVTGDRIMIFDATKSEY